jgi:hypothetical protein
MDIDLDLYRHEARVSSDPLVRLSAIDISPDLPKRTIIFIHGFGGQAEQWHYQLQKFALDNRVLAWKVYTRQAETTQAFFDTPLHDLPADNKNCNSRLMIMAKPSSRFAQNNSAGIWHAQLVPLGAGGSNP